MCALHALVNFSISLKTKDRFRRGCFFVRSNRKRLSFRAIDVALTSLNDFGSFCVRFSIIIQNIRPSINVISECGRNSTTSPLVSVEAIALGLRVVDRVRRDSLQATASYTRLVCSK